MMRCSGLTEARIDWLTRIALLLLSAGRKETDSNVHVDDLAEVYRLALERGVAGVLYHAVVAGGLNNRTLAEAVARDLVVPVRGVDFAEGVRRWGKFETLIGMATCNRSRSPRTRQELGWTPRHLDLLADVGHPAYRALARNKS
jgi:nucleoside-diphosphate-sugar epimerase